MKKFIKVTLIIILLLFLAALIGVSFYISSIYISARAMKLDEEALSSPYVNVKVFDSENIPIKEDNELNKAFASINSLSASTKNAFISIEDKNFLAVILVQIV